MLVCLFVWTETEAKDGELALALELTCGWSWFPARGGERSSLCTFTAVEPGKYMMKYVAVPQNEVILQSDDIYLI